MASPEPPVFNLPSMLGPRSLAEICLKVAIDNIHNIKGFGTMAIHYTNALLKAVKLASQLRPLELNSDDIYDETAVHWQRFIKKEFPQLYLQHQLVPENRESWHKVYDQYQKLHDEQVAADTKLLTQRLAAHNEQKYSRTSTIISCDQSAHMLPSRAKRGYGAPREEQTFIKKTERQIRMEKTLFNLRRASDKVRVPAGQIKKAPQAMIEAARIKSQPPRLTQQLPSDTRAPLKSLSELDREQMEARLRQVKNPAESKAGTTRDPTVLSGDEGDDLFGDECDDLFGDLESSDDDLFGKPGLKSTATSTSSSSKKTPSLPQPANKQSIKRRLSTEETATEQPAKRLRPLKETVASTSSSSNNKTPSLPQPANKQSAKRRLSTEETATERPAKRVRPLEETAASTSSSSIKASSQMPPPTTKKPGSARPKGLSAAPGANSIIRTYKYRPPPKTEAASNTPPRPFVAPTVSGQPSGSAPSTPTKTKAPHPAASGPRPYPEGGPTTRISRSFDGTVTPKKGDGPHRLRIMYPCRKLKPH
ncbi:hypothetical protein C8A00DRAFT_35875 [Chaetomidium leptoderma]|uniref:Elongin-A n=1 Tax=Chaetomidium leptoderma TaxID=669021 RepID=A0AAN6VJR6_9PEZI|nr:hypothetical protein C8A00DRAFT_35875 [Chaetomidium leptoderma]